MQKKPNWINNAYKSTEVHWGKTQTKILEMLGELGIEQTRFTSLPDRFVLEFVVKMDEISIPRAVRMVIPLTTKPGDEPRKRNAELNTIHRILLNQIKSKFIAIGTGLVEFETEFMAHLVVRGADGRDRTMGEALLPQYKKNLETGGGEYNLLGSGN